MTALIDIIFIVLVFLLLTANSPLLALAVDVPQSRDPAQLTPANRPHTFTISLLPTPPYWAVGHLAIADLTTLEQQLRQQLAAQPELKVIVAADRTAPVAPLMALLERLNKIKINELQILMKP